MVVKICCEQKQFENKVVGKFLEGAVGSCSKEVFQDGL